MKKKRKFATQQNRGVDRKHHAFVSYLVGRLTTMNTQRNSFRGREGFAIAVEHLEAEFGEAIIITIFRFLFGADGRVRLFTGFPLCDT